MADQEQIWTRRIALGDVPEEGLHVAMDAPDDVRMTLARSAGLRDLPHLSASFDLRRKTGGSLHIAGEVVATVGQNCVITLEPVDKKLHEMIDLMFAPGASDNLADSAGEASFGITDVEPLDALAGGEVDLGAIATEYFLLGIDPYPRKDGAVFEAAGAPDSSDSPFAALEALKGPPKKPPLGGK